MTNVINILLIPCIVSFLFGFITAWGLFWLYWAYIQHLRFPVKRLEK